MLSPPAIESKPLDYSGQRVVNGFIRPTDGVSQAVIMGASGVLPVVTLDADNPVRDVIDHNGVLHAVCGGKLFSIVSGVATELATVADGVTQMASSGTQIAIVANEVYHLWDGSVLSTPATGEVTTPRGVAYLSGFFIVFGDDTVRGDTFSVSNLNDGATFEGLDFATAESAPDEITGIASDHGQIWFFGSKTTEVWYNSGGSDFPFAPNTGAFVQQGCANGATVAQLDNALLWVSPDNTVLRSSGGQPAVISTPEIETEISKSVVTGGLAFFDKAHLIYGVTRQDDTMLCYDVTTQKWHERAQGALNDASPSAVCVANVLGVQYVGTANGKIAKLDSDTFTDDGEVLALEVVSSPVVQGGDPFSVSRVYMQISSGGVDIGRDALASLQTSRDGKNWTAGRSRKIGRKGDYMSELRWHGLGQFRTFWARLRITDPVPRDIHGVSYE